MAEIKRNIESGGIYINKWTTGLYNNRSPLFVPISAMGLQMISRMDTLWDGLNADLSHQMTLQRRPGFLRYCSTAFSSSEYPQQFFSFKNTSGTIKAMVETPTKVEWFDTTTVNTVITKTTTAQGSFVKVGSTLYYANGVDAKKWVSGTVSNWGIVAPATAPTITTISGVLSPLTGYTYVYVYKNSSTGHVSTASPVSGDTFAQTSKDFQLSGIGSSDPQVDQIEIYRTEDGGADYYYLATISNSGSWTYTDSSPDDDLNTFVVAPQNNQNDPPPTGAGLTCFYCGRVWIAKDNLLYFGGGSDVTNGVPEEAFPPANVFKLPGTIRAFAPTSQGLVVWTEDDAFVVLGSDLLSFRPIMWQKNFGTKSQNCVAQDGDLIFVFTSNRQLFSLSTSLSEIGFPIQASLGAFDPTTTYLTLHRSGADEGLFISNGVDTVYRYSASMQCWSSKYQPVGGVKCVSSIEVSTANYRLLMGRTAGSGYILSRDTNTYSDDGSAYPAYAIVGSINVAPPRAVTVVNSIVLETYPVGTYPTVSVLMNEISGTFVTIPNPVPDPPQLAGSTTVKMMRHDLLGNQSAMPLYARHLQVKITWATEAAKNELLGLGIV
jgi:hypothetical protein